MTNPDGLNMDPELTRRLLQCGPGGMEFLATEYGLPLEQLPEIVQEPGLADASGNRWDSLGQPGGPGRGDVAEGQDHAVGVDHVARGQLDGEAIADRQ